MILYILGLAIVKTLDKLLFFLPDVTALPLGMDKAVTFFISTIHSLISIFTFMEVPFRIILLVLFIRFTLWTWHWISYIVSLVRGGSSPAPNT